MKRRESIHQIFLLAIMLIIFQFGGALAGPIDLPRDNEGWTLFTPSGDSRILYVSANGNDSTGRVYASDSQAIGSDPFNPAGPLYAFASYAEAYSHTREGYPDWILIRRGDTFFETIGNKIHNGRSAIEPFLVAAYGSNGLSPVLKTGANSAIGQLSTGTEWVAISGISFYASSRDPDSVDYVGTGGAPGINYYGGDTQGILIEGCRFRFYTNNTIILVSGYDLNGWIIRRCAILDNYAHSGHSQGLYAYETNGLTIEECVFDHNGWYHDSNGTIGKATMFNHNAYFEDNNNVLFDGNIITRPSSMGNKFTAQTGASSSTNITMNNNLYVDCEIGMSLGGNAVDPLRFSNITVTNNVMTDFGRSGPTNRGVAWHASIQDWDGGTFNSNLFLSPSDAATNVWALYINGTTENVTIFDNVIFNIQGDGIRIEDRGTRKNFSINNNKIQLPTNGKQIIYAFSTSGVSFSNNTYFRNAAPNSNFMISSTLYSFSDWLEVTGDNSAYNEYVFPGSTASIETYQASIGGDATIDAFLTATRAQDRYNWDPRYTASRVNNFLRKGFIGNDSSNIPAEINSPSPVLNLRMSANN